MRFLVVSSRPPLHSAGLARSLMDALEAQGHSVDFLTRFDYPGRRDNEQFAEQKSTSARLTDSLRDFSRRHNFHKLLRNIKRGLYRLAGKNPDMYVSVGGLTFMYDDEAKPALPISLLSQSLHGNYDAVITLFWQEMLNSTSLKAMYDAFGCPILIYSPDMAPMTGGCFYFGNCKGYASGCGRCPALQSNDPNDRSHVNFALKRANYKAMNCAFLGNTWMNRFAEKTGLFRHIFRAEIIMDEKIFTPGDRCEARRSIGTEHDSFVILLRSTREKRKGNPDLLTAIGDFLDAIPRDKRDKIEVITIGEPYFKAAARDLPCKVTDLGTVDLNGLVRCYQAADVFMNASYDDAGPSMINQAIMCGTPVVCYDNGCAMDVIENGVSGYKTATGHTAGLTDGLLSLYSLSGEERARLRQSTREMAIAHNSSDNVARTFVNIVNRMQNAPRD